MGLAPKAGGWWAHPARRAPRPVLGDARSCPGLLCTRSLWWEMQTPPSSVRRASREGLWEEWQHLGTFPLLIKKVPLL